MAWPGFVVVGLALNHPRLCPSEVMSLFRVRQRGTIIVQASDSEQELPAFISSLNAPLQRGVLLSTPRKRMSKPIDADLIPRFHEEVDALAPKSCRSAAGAQSIAEKTWARTDGGRN